jgi:hypothetical protein
MAITFIGSTTGASAAGANVTLTLPGTYVSGDVAIVAVTLGTSKTTTLAVASSSGGAGTYTQIVSTITSSNTRFGVFGVTIQSAAALTQAVVTGTGGSTDATVAVVHIFRGCEVSTGGGFNAGQDVTAVSTTGSAATLTTANVTVVSCSDAIVNAGALGLNNVLTAASSYLQTAQTGAAATHPIRLAQAYVIYASTVGNTNMGSWTSTGSAAGFCTAVVPLKPSITYGGAFGAGPDTAAEVAREKRKVIVRSY